MKPPETDKSHATHSKIVGCHAHKKEHHWLKYMFPIAGLMSLIWFLIRVIPKPSRATYPCQRVAFPLASGFIAWLLGLGAASVVFRKARLNLARRRYLVGLVCIAVGVAAIWFALWHRRRKAGAWLSRSRQISRWEPPKASIQDGSSGCTTLMRPTGKARAMGIRGRAAILIKPQCAR